MKLSIIVPVYKVEPYLHRCVDSILAQTFTDFEVILVNDGSPDGCPAICDEYARRDSRVKVIHKKNGGVSDARNAGLDIAQGEYIGFVDSDDFIHPEMYKRMLKVAVETDADISCCRHKEISGEYQLEDYVVPCSDEKKIRVYEKNEILANLYPAGIPEFTAFVWEKLYRRRIFDTIRFPKGLVFEDLYIRIPCLCKANKLAIINDAPYYYYCQRSGSIMHSEYKLEWAIATNKICKNDLEILKSLNASDQYEYYLDEYLTRFFREYFAVKFYKPEFAKGFNSERKAFNRYFLQFVFCPKICNMSKLMLILLYISPKLSLVLAKKYMPHCVYGFMR